jgi:hypothetical protein
MKQKIINDFTVESLAPIQAADNSGLLVHADELYGWLGGMDAYRAKSAGGMSKDRPYFLGAKEGNDYTVNRVGREPLYVPSSGLCIIGGIQRTKFSRISLR